MDNIIYFDENKKSKVLVCILNHNDNENAERLLDIFSKRFDTVVFDSGSDVKNPRFVLLDNIYYGGQYNLACKKMIDEGYDWLYCICSDILIDDNNIESILDGVEKVSKSTNVGVFSSAVKAGSADDWRNFKNGTNTFCVTHMINGFSIMCSRQVIKDIANVISVIKYGWGMDIYTCYRAEALGLLCIVDNASEIFHPGGTSYGINPAADECRTFLKNNIPNFIRDNYIVNNNKVVCEKEVAK